MRGTVDGEFLEAEASRDWEFFGKRGMAGVLTMLAQLSPSVAAGPRWGEGREPEKSLLLGREMTFSWEAELDSETWARVGTAAQEARTSGAAEAKTGAEMR